MKEKYQLCNAGGIFHFIKLFKKHWWSRWEIEWDGNGPRIYMPDVIYLGKDIPFEEIKKEYLDAMKNELTWQDMKAIVKIADDLDPLYDPDAMNAEFQSEEAYYKEILKRFNETKK